MILSPWGITHVSASQIETFRRCPREWYFEKIMKLPRATGRHFNFGSSIHARIENLILGKQVFPSGWYRDHDLSMAEALKVKELFKVAKDEGVLPFVHDTVPMVEHNFCIPSSRDMSEPWVLGFIDMLRFVENIVTDWKTTSSWKYAKTPAELRDNVQMNIYAKALRVLKREMGEPDPEEITLQHGILLKENPYQCSVDSGPRTRLVEVTISNAHNDRMWEEIKEDTKEMNSLAKSGLGWYDIEAPPVPSSCMAFGGCKRKKICNGSETVQEHKEKAQDENRKRRLEDR